MSIHRYVCSCAGKASREFVLDDSYWPKDASFMWALLSGEVTATGCIHNSAGLPQDGRVIESSAAGMDYLERLCRVGYGDDKVDALMASDRPALYGYVLRKTADAQ